MNTDANSQDNIAQGALLVLAAALVWGMGGLLARLADIADPWVVIFWRTGIASVCLLAFMFWRDGMRGTYKLFLDMGWPGFAVGVAFATASTSFIIALQFTSVANILLMQAGVPLIAALLSRVFFSEPLRKSTWIAIGAVIAGILVMVSDSLKGNISPIGDGLAFLIAFAFAGATVITRRYSNIRMTPAACTGTMIGWLISVFMCLSTTAWMIVSTFQLSVMFVFGTSLALGLVCFTIGARSIPSAFAALLGTAETITGPLWVWLFLDETPSARTIAGGTIILVALIGYLNWQFFANYKIKKLPPNMN
uniref:DMT family transporter n=1 Tax=Pararhizobium sp. IMCC3301 TaxID=3067904 RepID=UPI0027419894|nr:DMT family transporter [Pararhizobium sp. IMCC3301]